MQGIYKWLNHNKILSNKLNNYLYSGIFYRDLRNLKLSNLS